MDMIERATAAVRAEIGTHCGNCGEQLPSDADSIVRAVLQVIREPGKKAIDAGINAAEEVEDWTQDSFERYRVDSASDMPLPVWQAMIDAALAE